MSIPLSEALQGVELEIGQTYRCNVKGRVVELRVLPIPPAFLPAPLDESDIMMDAWVELPAPGPGTPCPTKPGEPDLPDIPHIPSDEGDAS